MRWEDDWNGASTDLDLYLYHIPSRTFTTDYSEDEQSGQSGHVPFETFFFRSRVSSDDFGIVVVHHGGDVPDWIQLAVRTVDPIQHHTGSGSITNPAESANPGMLAVGAAPWYDVNTIEPYSSRGPTPDGRVKPDIVGADCGETALSPLNQRQRGFCGTSQAAPHVAGLAALVRQRFPDYTPTQVAAYLKEQAQQRLTPDPNNTWGHGFAKLPAVDRAALETLYNATGGDNWTNNTNWMTSGALSTWYGVTTDSQGRITELNLTRNQLKGELPPELANLTNLEVLAIGRNQLTGKIPAWLGKLTDLTILDLDRNQLTGEIPEELGSLTNLQRLNLSENQLTEPIPSDLANLTNLERLNLGGNQLTGEIPGKLGNLANLGSLYLYDNQLTGEIPAELGNLANLQSLNLNRNQLTGEMPSELGGLTNLEWLDLWENQLTGPIPAELGSLTNLQGLDLTLNQLTGEIPTELANLTNLEVLALGGNQLTGTVPAWLGSLANLQELYLWGNELTGPIPSELGGLPSLQTLDLWENQLTGPIPSELGGLPSLEWLDLSENQLTGPIPPELSRLTKLEHLSLSQNMLTGCVPEAWRDITESDVLELGLPFCTVSLNTAPVFSDSESNPITEAGRSVVENTAAGENVGIPVAATDNNGDTLNYALGGTDAASFDIDPLTGQLMTKEALDYETKDSYEVMVTATDPEGASDMITVTITVTNLDEAGTVTLSSEKPTVGDNLTATLGDPDGDLTDVTWQWSKSADMDSWMDISGRGHPTGAV